MTLIQRQKLIAIIDQVVKTHPGNTAAPAIVTALERAGFAIVDAKFLAGVMEDSEMHWAKQEACRDPGE